MVYFENTCRDKSNNIPYINIYMYILVEKYDQSMSNVLITWNPFPSSHALFVQPSLIFSFKSDWFIKGKCIVYKRVKKMNEWLKLMLDG
jgi:tRNA U34 5-methylaminomethyl-2-thiouridine-forming methyltransferase MnmC